MSQHAIEAEQEERVRVSRTDLEGEDREKDGSGGWINRADRPLRGVAKDGG